MAAHPGFWPGDSHGQGGLAGCSPGGHRVHTTEGAQRSQFILRMIQSLPHRAGLTCLFSFHL